MLAELRAAQDHAELLQRWLQTPTWSDSRRFLQQYPELISEPRTLDLLEAGSDDPMMAQHLGIALLTARMPLAEVYDTVTDLDMAVDTARNAVEKGDHSMLGELMLAAPGLGRLPFVTPFLHAVYAALTGAEPPEDGTEETTREPIYAAAEQGSDTQRAAGAARLRRLARRQPEQAAALQKLINILAAPDDHTPRTGPTTDAAATTTSP